MKPGTYGDIEMINLIERGRELLAEGKGERAIACFSKVAETDPRGYIEMARCYERGIEVRYDPWKARKCLELADRLNKRIKHETIRSLRHPEMKYRGMSRAGYECLAIMRNWERRAA